MGKTKRKSLELELKAATTLCYRYGLQFKGLCPYRKQGYCAWSMKPCKSTHNILMFIPKNQISKNMKTEGLNITIKEVFN
jgi:hypothetical protein